MRIINITDSLREIVADEGKVLFRNADNERKTFARSIMRQEETLADFTEVEYVEPTPIDEELEIAKHELIDRIKEYDSSPEVNSFRYNGVDMWVDRETRVSLRDTAKIEAEAGIEQSTLWTEQGAITLPPQTIVQLLSAIEIYAHQCYNVTQQHIANVMAIDSQEGLEAYDYTQGYPEKLVIGE